MQKFDIGSLTVTEHYNSDAQIINYDHKSKKFTIQYDEDDVCNFTIEELVEDCRTEDFAVLWISNISVVCIAYSKYYSATNYLSSTDLDGGHIRKLQSNIVLFYGA